MNIAGILVSRLNVFLNESPHYVPCRSTIKRFLSAGSHDLIVYLRFIGS